MLRSLQSENIIVQNIQKTERKIENIYGEIQEKPLEAPQ